VSGYSRLLLLLLSLVAGGIPSAAAGQLSESEAAPERGSELTVYLMTMGPGSMVWERFGHNAIWIRDDGRGTDIAYNYGMFSFQQDAFVLRFIRGHMDYWMEGFDAFLTAAAYMRDDRSVWAQELNLTPAQRADLQDFLEWNARPENAFYRYDYYRDNCSTRVRDALDRVLGGQIEEQTGGLPSGTTYRAHTASLTADDPVIYTGLMAGLGQPVDREISVWEEMFLPMMLREHARRITVDDGHGGRVPLVRSEQAIFTGSRAEELPDPPGRLSLFLALGLALGGTLYAAGRYAHRRRGARVVFGVLGSFWSLLAGTLGVVLLGLWAFTDHATSYRNENLFFFSPLLLPLVGLVPAAIRGLRGTRRAAYAISGTVAVISLLGLLAGFLPPFFQMNGELVALALPVNLALAAACRELSLRDSPGRPPAQPPRARGGGARPARI